MGYSPKLSNYGERSRFASPFACGSCVTSRDSPSGELACRLCRVGNPALLLLWLLLLLSSVREKAFEAHLFILSELLFDKILSRVPMRFFFSRGGKFIGRPLRLRHLLPKAAALGDKSRSPWKAGLVKMKSLCMIPRLTKSYQQSDTITGLIKNWKTVILKSQFSLKVTLICSRDVRLNRGAGRVYTLS